MNTKSSSLDSLRTWENLPCQYNCVQLLHKKVMDLAGYEIVGVHFSLSHFALFNNFIIIKYWHTLLPKLLPNCYHAMTLCGSTALVTFYYNLVINKLITTKVANCLRAVVFLSS
jgi:hypothetical protein